MNSILINCLLIKNQYAIDENGIEILKELHLTNQTVCIKTYLS